MPRFVTRGCVICQPQGSVLGRHMSSVIRSISASSPCSLVTDLRCWRWFLELSQCQWFPKEFGKQRIPNDESSGCRTSLVASTIHHFLQHLQSKILPALTYMLFIVYMFIVFGCCNVVDLWKKYTRNWESFWHRYPGTWRTKFIFPVSSWFC